MIGLKAVLAAISIVVLCLMAALLVVVLLFLAQEFWSHIIAPALLARKKPEFVDEACFECDLTTCVYCLPMTLNPEEEAENIKITADRKKAQEKQDG